MKLEPIDLNETVREATILAARPDSGRKVRIQNHFAPGDPKVLADRTLVQQVIANLLSNAIEASTDGTGAECVLHVETASDTAGFFDVIVKDHGSGIREDDLAKIFDPFFTRKDNGLGLGLAVCRSIAEAHGGRIKARNRPDGGARFCLSLPAFKEHENV